MVSRARFWILLALLPASAAAAEPLEKHLQLIGVKSFHDAGQSGKGVVVAVLDSGFRGYRDQLGKALPRNIKTRSFRDDGDLEAKNSPHGLLCAEIIHTVAPEAELLLANWEPDSPAHFLRAVRWAKEQGAKIISCSVVMPGWSDGLGGGSVHAELEKILGEPDARDRIQFVAAAGNLAERHWRGPFRDDGSGNHLWFPTRNEQSLVPWGNAPVSVEISHAPGSEFVLEVRDQRNGDLVGRRFDLPATGFGGHALRFVPENGHHYAIRVHRKSGSKSDFRLVVLGAAIEKWDPAGSVVFPADGKEIIGVGAIDANDRRCSFSGCGGANTKLDCVAPVPFPTRNREGFSGTSAAAPQAAGIMALMLSDGKTTPAATRKRLFESCRDVGDPGRDAETGFGAISFGDRLINRD